MSFLKTRLATMMFLQYVIWGAWYVTITTYLTQTLHFTGTQAGLVFSTVSIASLVSPFFVGLVADRFFATERVMAFLYVVSAVLVYMVTQVTTFPAVFGLMLAFCLCYFPTVALTNSLTMQQVKDPGRDFPPIRTLGTLGFIVVVTVVSFLKLEASSTQFVFAAGASVLMAIYSLFALPHTPPPAKGQQITWQRAVGLDTLSMMKQPSFAVFVIASILACIPLTFYYSFANAYLNDLHINNAGAMMTLGPVGRARHAAGDAAAVPVRQHPRRPVDRPGVVGSAVSVARARQRRRQASGCSTSRSCCTAPVTTSSLSPGSSTPTRKRRATCAAARRDSSRS